MAADILVSSAGGSWKNTEDVEDNLTLDELLMLSTQIGKNKWYDWKFLAAIEGIEMDDGPYEERNVDHSDEELPPELLEREREWQRKKQEHLESNGADSNEFEGLGLGYIKK